MFYGIHGSAAVLLMAYLAVCISGQYSAHQKNDRRIGRKLFSLGYTLLDIPIFLHGSFTVWLFAGLTGATLTSVWDWNRPEQIKIREEYGAGYVSLLGIIFAIMIAFDYLMFSTFQAWR